jgi:tRNA nucleotidyltransferase (CCA-adding enzyme)
LGLMPFLYPGAKTDRLTWQKLSKIEEVLNWTSNYNWDKKPDRELVYLGGLFFRLESEERSAIIRKLYLSREKSAILNSAFLEVPAVHKKLNWSDLNASQVASFLEHLPVETLLLTYALAEDDLVKSYLEQYITELRFVHPELDGSVLKEMGLKPGPLYRKIIERLKQAVLDGEVRGMREELEFVENYLSNLKRKGDY